MFDKMFEEMARRELTENAFSRWCKKRDYKEAKKIGAVVTFPDGTEGIDVVKVHAHTLKQLTFEWLVIMPASAIIGHVLGNMTSRR